jgi:hypothetical protein
LVGFGPGPGLAGSWRQQTIVPIAPNSVAAGAGAGLAGFVVRLAVHRTLD